MQFVNVCIKYWEQKKALHQRQAIQNNAKENRKRLNYEYKVGDIGRADSGLPATGRTGAAFLSWVPELPVLGLLGRSKLGIHFVRVVLVLDVSGLVHFGLGDKPEGGGNPSPKKRSSGGSSERVPKKVRSEFVE